MSPELRKFVEAIKKALLAHEERRQQAWIDDMVVKNSLARGEILHSFLYGGVCYRSSGAPKGKLINRGLHHNLTSEMAAFEKDKRAVERDRQFIGQILMHLVTDCVSHQDLRDVFPECLISIIPELAKLPRQREDAFTIRENPMIYQQYLDWLPKIEMYIATRLMF